MKTKLIMLLNVALLTPCYALNWQHNIEISKGQLGAGAVHSVVITQRVGHVVNKIFRPLLPMSESLASELTFLGQNNPGRVSFFCEAKIFMAPNFRPNPHTTILSQAPVALYGLRNCR